MLDQLHKLAYINKGETRRGYIGGDQAAGGIPVTMRPC
jgi:hypothetical protein